MRFITYWELSEDMTLEERSEIAQKLTTSHFFPLQGVEIVRWDATPDGWGVLVAEADDAAAIANALNAWRAAGRGFFRLTKTAPAMPVQATIAGATDLLTSVPV
ncbi:MAG: DUF3303 family protein [Trueperaceae bacterium]|nr:MAG: DUF3303 family protein [Trueperaceae bacterium]